MASETSPKIHQTDVSPAEFKEPTLRTEEPLEQPSLKDQVVEKAVAAKDFVIDKATAAKNIAVGAAETVGEKMANVQARTEEKLGPHLDNVKREVAHVQGVCTRATTDATAALHEHSKCAAESLREQQREMEREKLEAKHDFSMNNRSPFPYCDNVHCFEYAPCAIHGMGNPQMDQRGLGHVAQVQARELGAAGEADSWATKLKEEAQHVKEVIVNATANAVEKLAEKTGVAKTQLEEQQRKDEAHYGKDYLPQMDSTSFQAERAEKAARG